MTMLLVLSLVCLQVVHSQIQEPDCPVKITELFNNQGERIERFFKALRQIESEGDQCKINEARIGPYQLSEQYYAEAVSHDERLRLGGTYDGIACTYGYYHASFVRCVVNM